MGYIKNKKIAVYNGEHYEYNMDGKNQHILTAKNEESLEKGFDWDPKNGYTKKVKKEELESIFKIKTVCNIKAYITKSDDEKVPELDVVQEDGDKVKITTADPEIYKKLKSVNVLMNENGHEEYELWIDRKEVQIYDKEEAKYKRELNEKVHDIIVPALDSLKSSKENNSKKLKKGAKTRGLSFNFSSL